MRQERRQFSKLKSSAQSMVGTQQPCKEPVKTFMVPALSTDKQPLQNTRLGLHGTVSVFLRLGVEIFVPHSSVYMECLNVQFFETLKIRTVMCKGSVHAIGI